MSTSNHESRRLVAIVDDEALVRVSLRRLCGVMGFATSEHASGADFLSMLDSAAFAPDCLLLDAHMPEMTGLDVLAVLVRRGVAFPTLMFTADDGIEARNLYLAAGAVGCLRKPTAGDVLAGAINAAIAAHVTASRAS